MKHLAAYLLLALGGNSSPSAKDIKKVLESVGIEADSERLETLISELKGKDLQEVRHIWMGSSKFNTNGWNSWSPRVPASWPLFLPVDLVVDLLLLLPELLQVALLLKRRRKKRQKVYLYTRDIVGLLLTLSTEKEESDEDMGFGLFD
jgi:ribosomal protein L12E/L44/L45/RPP1/RPP2